MPVSHRVARHAVEHPARDAHGAPLAQGLEQGHGDGFAQAERLDGDAVDLELEGLTSRARKREALARDAQPLVHEVGRASGLHEPSRELLREHG